MVNKKKQKLIIIDGNALIHRSFHALPTTITTKKGEVVNAVYGFANVLIKAIREIKPDYVVLTLDKKGPTFRHIEYKEYKATRIKAPDELYSQIPRVKEIANVFGIPVYDLSGFEADDLIGTIARSVDGLVEKIILTGDMDTLQLVNEHTFIYTLSRGLTDSVIYDEAKVKERYGLGVSQMIDYKALRGDPSDNIPGVKGIGEKTATELLQEFGTLEKIYEQIEKIKNQSRTLGTKIKIKERILNLLIEYREDAFMSKKLATIDTNAPIKFDIDGAKFGNFDQKVVFDLFSELEFKSLLPRVKELGNSKSKVKTEKQEDGLPEDKFVRNEQLFKYQLVDDEKKFDKFFEKLEKQLEFTFDTETSSLDTMTADLLGVSFSWKEGEAHFVQVKSNPPAGEAGKSKKESQGNNLFNYNKEKSATNHVWLERLKPIFEDEKIKKIGHNIKFDVKVLRERGIKTKGIYFDTMIASYLLNPGTRQHNLDALAFTELGFEKISKENLLGTGKNKESFDQVSVEKLSNYSCEDADFTNRLANKLLPEIKKRKLDKLFFEIEMPLVEVLVDMELLGIKIDSKYLLKISQKLHYKIDELQKEIYKQAGTEFNINSTQQLREVLFEKLQLPTQNITKTKTGLSTGADELAKLSSYHPIIGLIQEHRELMKLLNTYIDALPELVNKKTKRLHTCFNQAVTATGRLSSTDPNIQNIPVRTELGREIRSAFIAEDGYELMSLDYSQIELRLAAYMSGDKKMIKAFKEGLDIHTATAAEINDMSLDAVTKEMRREAKATNFGILYGQGAHGLSQTAGIPYARAKEFIDSYFSVYDGVKEYIEKTLEQAKIDGFVKTLFGRKRYLPEINSSMVMVRKGAERMAINTPIQGTAADMIKTAMIQIQVLIKKNFKNNEIRMLLQVHDELIFEVKDNLATEIAPQIKKIMENVIKLTVPIVVDVKVGKSWGETESITN